MKSLVCENVVKVYSNKKVLDNVSLTIEPNKIYGLIGRNGVGKTTLMSIMTAQNTCDSGTITYGGEQVWENQNSLNNICFSREINPTIANSNTTFKIKDYLKMASFYYPYWDKAYAEKLINEFELDIKKKVYKSSKGMLSMVTIITALASRAPITILDEPVAGLDIIMREKFYSLLLENYTETGRTFVISTHIIEEAVSIFEEIILLHDSKILLKENTQELLSRFYTISGHEDVIDKIKVGLEIVHTENMGRSKTICVKLKDAQEIKTITKDVNVDVSAVTLQKLFVYLTTTQKGVK